MKVLVLTGPESSGKSWLAEQLQARFGGRVRRRVRPPLHRRTAPRHLLRRHPRHRPRATGLGGRRSRRTAGAADPRYPPAEQHPLSRILFGDCPDWLEPALLRRRYDLHLLLSPEGVAWSADGQRCQPELAQRQAFHRECQAWLERHRQPYRAIAGDWAERRRQAFAAVQGLLRDG
ncbi:AAA family ATPase [Pseudomonas aeruginosa]|nr:AAA family ATPase [Pseudomonas aeruginosa]